MKRLFGILLVCLSLIFLEVVTGAEENKILTSKFFQPVQVPEQAPEFYTWPGDALGGLDLGRGRALVMVQAINPDQTVMVLALFFKEDDKIFLVGMDCHYRNGQRYIIEDVGFKATGKPSGILMYQENALTMEDLQRLFPLEHRI
jgi:hypothetical protein